MLKLNNQTLLFWKSKNIGARTSCPPPFKRSDERLFVLTKQVAENVRVSVLRFRSNGSGQDVRAP